MQNGGDTFHCQCYIWSIGSSISLLKIEGITDTTKECFGKVLEFLQYQLQHTAYPSVSTTTCHQTAHHMCAQVGNKDRKGSFKGTIVMKEKWSSCVIQDMGHFQQQKYTSSLFSTHLVQNQYLTVVDVGDALLDQVQQSPRSGYNHMHCNRKDKAQLAQHTSIHVQHTFSK